MEILIICGVLLFASVTWIIDTIYDIALLIFAPVIDMFDWLGEHTNGKIYWILGFILFPYLIGLYWIWQFVKWSFKRMFRRNKRRR